MKLLLYLFFSSTCLHCFGQYVEVEYLYKRTPPTNSAGILSAARMQLVNEGIQSTNFVYKYVGDNDQAALIYQPNKSWRDSSATLHFNIAPNDYFCFSDAIYFVPSFGARDTGQVFPKGRAVEWEINLSQRDTIAGIPVVKAFGTLSDSYGSHELFAWFAPSIPCKFGPEGLIGLPGLILDLRTDQASWTARSIVYHDGLIPIHTTLDSATFVNKGDEYNLWVKSRKDQFGTDF